MCNKILYLLIAIVFIACDKSNNSIKTNSVNDYSNHTNVNKARQITSEIKFEKPELDQYVDDIENVFTYRKTIEEFSYFIKFKPLDYIISKELDDSISQIAYQKRKNEISDFDYFTLVISIQKFNDEPLRYKLNEPSEYYEKLTYLMNEVGKDLKYFNGNDTVDCSIFHFERTFGVSPYLTLNLAFEKSNSKKDRVLIFDDHLFNNGRIIFTMPNEIFIYQPKLIFK
jgi:hypothetical protein